MARVIGSVDISFRSGPNRVIAMCRDAGIPVPEFEEITGAAVVTFRVNVAGTQQLGTKSAPSQPQVAARAGTKSGPSRDQVGTKSGLSRDQVEILRLCRKERTLVELMTSVSRKNRTKFRVQFIKPLLDLGLLQMTIPDKPNSRFQKYRTTTAGEKALKGAAKK